MSNIPITPGSGANVATDLISSNNYQQIKIVDGTVGSTTPLKINADGSITASIYGNITTTSAPASVSGTVGASVIGNVNTTITSVATGGGVLPVSFTATTSSGSDSVNLATIANTAGVNGSFPLPTAGFVYNGTNFDRTRGNSSIGTLVSTGASSVITVSQGSIATAVTGTVTTQFAPVSSLTSGAISAAITGTASVLVLSAPPGSQRNYITNVLVTNSAANGTIVAFIDNGVPIFVGYAAANGGGFSAAFPVPLQQPGTNKGLYVVSSVQASVYVSASGYTAL